MFHSWSTMKSISELIILALEVGEKGIVRTGKVLCGWEE